MKAPPYTHLPARHERRPIRDMTLRDLFWIVVFSLPGAVALPFHVYWVCVLSFALAIFGGLAVYEHGRGIDYPGEWWESYKIKRNGNVIYDATGGRKRAGIVIPFRYDIFGDITSTYHIPTDTDILTVEVGGWVHANDDMMDRHLAEIRNSELFKTVISQIDGEMTIGVQQSRRPHDAKDWWDRCDEHLFKEHDENDEVDQRQRALLGSVFARIQAGSPRYTQCFTIAVPRPKEWRNIAANPQAFDVEKKLQYSPIKRALDALIDGLERNGYRDVRLLSGDDLRLHDFRQCNVSYLEQEKAKLLDALATEGEETREGYRLADRPIGTNGKPIPWPLFIKIEPMQHLVQTEHSFHRVLMIDRHNRDKVLPGGLDSLFLEHQLHHWVCVSTSVTTVSKSLEYFLLTKRRDFKQALIKYRFSGGMIEDEKSRDEQTADAEKVDSLYRSNSRPIRRQTAIIISASTPEMVDNVEASVKSVLRGLQIETKVLKGRARLFRMFLKAIIGFRSKR